MSDFVSVYPIVGSVRDQKVLRLTLKSGRYLHSEPWVLNTTLSSTLHIHGKQRVRETELLICRWRGQTLNKLGSHLELRRV